MEPFARHAPPPTGVSLGVAPRDRGDDFLRAVEKASRGISDPVAKLRFIRNSMRRYQELDRLVRLIPVPRVRRFVYHWLSLDSVQPLMMHNYLGGPARGGPNLRRPLWAFRGAAAGIAALALCVVGASLWQLTRPAAAAPALPLPPVLRAVAEPLSPLPPGLAPGRVWLVETGHGFEQYSNGLRIDTTWATAGEARRFRVFDAVGGLHGASHNRPAGLLFHTTESDIWPLEAEYNEKLRDSSERLLKYLQRNRTYHYLVDRFGRVFRVVDEAGKANHAGNSIWENAGTVYLNLNHAFLGVSFESRWGGGQTLPITQAQLVAGRGLTDYLRQHYGIPPEMCVAHGLTSVNPKRHRIGHHLDWSRGFPRAAFGLPDQYVREPPSVALFGFGYDDDFLKVLPEPWAGVRAAEKRLADEAYREGRDLLELRRTRQELYDRWALEQAQADRKGVSDGD